MSIQTFDPTRRPGLAYQHAFDWLAVRLAGSATAACLASSTFNGVEMLRRLPELPFLEPLPNGLNAAAAALGFQLNTNIPSGGQLTAIALLEPAASDLENINDVIMDLSPTGSIYLMAGGLLARYLVERRTNQNGQAAYLSDRQAVHHFRQLGFIVSERAGWHGPKAIAWHTASQSALVIGQRNRRDRYHQAMRRDFSQPGISGRAAALTCMTLKRAS